MLTAWRGPGTPSGEQSPRGPRLTAWYPADDITVLVSMATASHGRLGSRSYVTAQATGLRPHMAPSPRPTTTCRCPPASAHPDPMGPALPGSTRQRPAAPWGAHAPSRQHHNSTHKPDRPSTPRDGARRGPRPLCWHRPGCQGQPRAQEPLAWWCRQDDQHREKPRVDRRWEHRDVYAAQLGVPRGPPATHLAPGPTGWKELRGTGSQVMLPTPAGDHFAAEVQPLPGSCHRICGLCRQRQAAPTPSPMLPSTAEGVTPPGHGGTQGHCQVPPAPARPARAPLPHHSPGMSGTGAGGQDGAGQRERQLERSRAEPCQASIPALSRPPPQGSLNMNRPFNLLRRLEGLAAGLLAGTHSPAVGTAQSCSQQGFPPTLPAQGIPKLTLLPTLAARGPLSRGTVPAPPGAHLPHRAALGLQHQPQCDLLMAFYSALNWVGKRHVPYPKSSLIALHGAGR